MNLAVTILIGVGVGVMVELVLPGHTFSELLLAVCLGTAGALLARYVGEAGGWFEASAPESFVAAALGAVMVLFLYGALFRRRWKGRSR